MASNGITENSKVDVLIIGAGPAGLMAANWLAHQGVSMRIVDKRGTKVYNGQADGLQTRTLEIFDSFGFSHRAVQEGSPLSGISSWIPSESGGVQRSTTMAAGGTWLQDSRFRSVTVHQGRIERFLIDSIAEASGVDVERGVLPESLSIDESLVESDNEYPIHIRLRHLTEEEATPKAATTTVNGKDIQNGLFRSNMAADDTADVLKHPLPKDGFYEEVDAKYLIGGDGAHSWVRNQLGFKLEGESTDYIWGVLDVRWITDFPDTRLVCTIQSAQHGSILLIPREKGLVRVYVQLQTVNKDNHNGAKFDRASITPEVIMESCRKIIHPYKARFMEIEWWTVYQVGQRVGNRFSLHNRVFLAGDAVHTHSPKAGQGMNVSMGDTYNLGWKLGAVIHGLSDRSLLSTYEPERRKVAQDLINLDHRLSRVFSGQGADGAVTPSELSDLYLKNMQFIAGMGVAYQSSAITAIHSSIPGLTLNFADMKLNSAALAQRATGIQLGRRIGDYAMISLANSSQQYLHSQLASDGRWRIVLFAGDLQESSGTAAARLNTICTRLNAPASFVRRFTPASQSIDAVFHVFAIHAGARAPLADFAWPHILRPYHPERGLDYGKVFGDENDTNTYSNYGVDPQAGCAVIVRPDQYVSWIGAPDDYESMDRFFAGFMRVQTPQHEGAVGLPADFAGY